MPEPKTRPTNASVEAFIDAQPEARRADCRQLVAMMKKATQAEAVMWGTAIVGFGSYLAPDAKATWPVVAFSPRKSDLTVYLMPGFEGQAEALARLGKHKTGKVCLYLKSLQGIDLAALQQLIDDSVQTMRAKYPPG